MKLIGFWLLCLVAVLVPATASMATSMLCPEAFVAQVTERQPVKDAAVRGHHRVASAALRSGAQPVAAQRKSAAQKPGSDVGSPSDEPCCDFTVCNHCTSCSACTSMIAVDGQVAASFTGAATRIADFAAPRAEFLLSGQERPPRSA